MSSQASSKEQPTATAAEAPRHGTEGEAPLADPIAALHHTFGNRAVRQLLDQRSPWVLKAVASRIGNRQMVQLLQQRSSAGQVVQRRLAGDGSAAGIGDQAVHRAAEQGTRGADAPLPHADVIQRAFGGHDVRGIRAHLGPDATASAKAMGAEAFASGDHVVFARPPDLRVAAHEAAHVVQQRAGVHLPGGVGRAGDAYEQLADAVADRVVRGQSAEPLLAPARSSAPPAIQRKLTDEASPSDRPWDRERATAYLDTKKSEVKQYLEGVMARVTTALDKQGAFVPGIAARIEGLVRKTLIEEVIKAGNEDQDRALADVLKGADASLDQVIAQLGKASTLFHTKLTYQDYNNLQGVMTSNSSFDDWIEPWGALAKGRVKALSEKPRSDETDAEIDSIVENTSSISRDVESSDSGSQRIVTDMASLLQGRQARFSATFDRAISSRFVKEAGKGTLADRETLREAVQGNLEGHADLAKLGVQAISTPLDEDFFSIAMSAITGHAVDVVEQGGILKAVASQEGDALTRLAYLLRFVPREVLRREFHQLMSEPEELERVNRKLFRLTHVELNATGGVMSLSAPTTREMLRAAQVDAGRTAAWSTAQERFESFVRKQDADLPGPLQDILANLQKEKFYQLDANIFVLGRTAVFEDPRDERSAYAIKLLKRGEPRDEFERELKMQAYLLARSQELELRSVIPTPVGLYRVTVEQWQALQGFISAGIARSQERADELEEPPVKDVALEDDDHKKLDVMIYRVDKRYFVYQNRDGLRLPRTQEPDFAQSQEAFHHDAMVLLREGIAFPQLIDLNHNSERIYNWMIDVMRVYDSLQGMGKISNWKTAARYPNIRATGLADLGDMAFLGSMEFDVDAAYSTNEIESGKGKVWTTMGPQKEKMLIAQYLGNYLLSAILTEAHGFFVTGNAALQQREREASRHDLAGRLKSTFVRGAAHFTAAFGGGRLPETLVTDDEIELLAEQMLYFLGGEYVPPLESALLDSGGIEKHEPREPEHGNAFDTDLARLYPGASVTPLKELDEQEAAGFRGTRLALGRQGIYTIHQDDDWRNVRRDVIDKHPEEHRNVDLGFINGPQPLAALQQILYKVVGYATMALSRPGGSGHRPPQDLVEEQDQIARSLYWQCRELMPLPEDDDDFEALRALQERLRRLALYIADKTYLGVFEDYHGFLREIGEEIEPLEARRREAAEADEQHLRQQREDTAADFKAEQGGGIQVVAEDLAGAGFGPALTRLGRAYQWQLPTRALRTEFAKVVEARYSGKTGAILNTLGGDTPNNRLALYLQAREWVRKTFQEMERQHRGGQGGGEQGVVIRLHREEI